MLFELPALPVHLDANKSSGQYVLLAQADRERPFENADPILYQQYMLELEKRKKSSLKGETPQHLKDAEKRLKGEKVAKTTPKAASPKSFYAKVELQPFFSKLSGKSKNGGSTVSVSSNNSSFYRLSLGQADGFQFTEVFLEGQYYDLEPAKNGTLDDSEKYTTSFGVNHRCFSSSVGMLTGLSFDSNFLFGGTNTSSLKTYNTQYLSPKLGVEGRHGKNRNFHWQATYRYGFNVDSPTVKTDNKQEVRAKVGYGYKYKNSTFDLSYDYRFMKQENVDYKLSSNEHGPTLSYRLSF